jgi:predicted acylesterase/phospholipase RssA
MPAEKTTVALFNNGGGMRGLIPAHFMARLEDVTGLRMADMVDIFTGPSTGAILNAALNVPHFDQPTQPRFRARHMVRFYEREGIKIFPPDQYREWRGLLHDMNNRTLKISQLNALIRRGHYDPSHLQRSLKAMYGETPLSDSLRSLVVPCYNIDGGQLRLVRRNTDGAAHTEIRPGDPGGHAVWLKNIKTGYPNQTADATPYVMLYDAVMGSCAAPTYFPCHHFNVRWPGDRHPTPVSAIDGNMFDNSCISYLAAIKPHVPPDHKLIMLVLGTGHTNKSVSRDEWNSFGPLGVVDPANDLPLINIFFHSSESALMDGFAREMGENLFVFNKSMIDNPASTSNPSVQIDDATPENLEKMRHFFEAMMEENKDQFDRLCHILVDRRDQRQEKQETAMRRARKYFSFFQGLRSSDRTAVEDHEAQGED